MNPPKFTEQQLQDWKAYERLRETGKFNMLFPGASRAAGLPEKRYLFCLQNYSALKEEADRRVLESL